MDNCGRGHLKVPGFGGIALDVELPCESRFSHGIFEWRQLPAITAREFAAVALMNEITDKPNWNAGVFNASMVAAWREEAFTNHDLVNEKAWEWCLMELRDKAKDFEKHGHVRVLDTGSCVCKADLLPEAIGDALRLAAAQKRATETRESGLVDPYMYPLVYGKSLVLREGGSVDLHNMFGECGRATRAPETVDPRVESDKLHKWIARKTEDFGGVYPHRGSGYYFWSYNYQALPCEINFVHGSGTDVRINSYINNLHPSYKSLYHCIEKLTGLSIPLWNDCLIRGKVGLADNSSRAQRGRVPARIVTYGVEWEHELPAWAERFNVPSESDVNNYFHAKGIKDGLEAEIQAQERKRQTTENLQRLKDLQKQLRKVEAAIYAFRNREEKLTSKLPPGDSDLWRAAREYLAQPEPRSQEPLEIPNDIKDSQMYHWILEKHRRLMFYKHPDLGAAVPYEHWRIGRDSSKAVVGIVDNREVWERGGWKPDWYWDPYTAEHTRYKISLEEEFRGQGLQVIVEMDEVAVVPGVEGTSTTKWKIDGQKNEHIVAVAIVAYEMDNIKCAEMAFRQETPMEEQYYDFDEWKRCGHPIRFKHHRSIGKVDEERKIAEIFGFKEVGNGRRLFSQVMPCQEIGAVDVRQDRLIAFPSTMEYRLQGLTLVDSARPGCLRTVKLLLVDPNYRICSTRNVPPQQHEWWAAAVEAELLKALPAEIVSDILKYTDDWPMSEADAMEHKARCTKELRLKDMVRYGKMKEYGFGQQMW